MMDQYSSLVSKVLNNEFLAKSAKDMFDEDYLNLITKDWLPVLENNATYQDFSSHSQSLWKPSFINTNYQYEESKRQNFHVLVVGYCKFVKPFEGKRFKPGIIVMDAEPLSKIAQAMTSDLSPSVELSNEFKFSFTDCSILSCDDCSISANLFAKAGYKVTRQNQPCILDTKVFDGKRVVNRFLSHMESMFNESFLAILHLKINNRYSYIDSNKRKTHRISGNVLNIIGLNESKLTLTKKANVGPLAHCLGLESEIGTTPTDEHVTKSYSPKDDMKGFLSELIPEDDKSPPKRKNISNLGDITVEKKPRLMVEEEDNRVEVDEDFMLLDNN